MRILGIVMLLFGAVQAGNLWNVYHTGASFSDRDIPTATISLVYGLVILIEPRALKVWYPRDHEQIPARFKVLLFLVGAISIGSSLYLDQVVFKDWETLRSRQIISTRSQSESNNRAEETAQP